MLDFLTYGSADLILFTILGVLNLAIMGFMVWATGTLRETEGTAGSLSEDEKVPPPPANQNDARRLFPRIGSGHHRGVAAKCAAKRQSLPRGRCRDAGPH